MTTTDTRKEWQKGLAKAAAKDWKVLLWASDAYMQMGLAYKDGYTDAKAEDAQLLEACERALTELSELHGDHEGGEPENCSNCAAFPILEAAIAQAQAAQNAPVPPGKAQSPDPQA